MCHSLGRFLFQRTEQGDRRQYFSRALFGFTVCLTELYLLGDKMRLSC